MIPPSESWSVLLLASSLEHSKSHISRNPTWYSGGKVSIGGGSWTPPGAMRLVSTSQLSNALNCTGSKSKKIRPSRSFGRTLSQRPLNNWDKREPSMAVKVSRLVTKLVSPPTFSLSGECFAKLCPENNSRKVGGKHRTSVGLGAVLVTEIYIGLNTIPEVVTPFLIQSCPIILGIWRFACHTPQTHKEDQRNDTYHGAC